MMKKVFSIAAALLLFVGNVALPSVASAYAWTPLSGAGYHHWGQVAASTDGQKLFAVDNGGYIYHSVDGGSTWTTLTTAGTYLWSSIAASGDGVHVVASVEGGYIYVSSNSGSTWTQATSLGMHEWKQLAISGDGMTILAGSFLSADPDDHNIHISRDGGSTWTAWGLASPVGAWGWVGLTISADGSKMAAMNSLSTLYTSTDHGATWTMRTIPAGLGVASSGASLVGSTDGMHLAAYSASASSGLGQIYTSGDGGVTWVVSASGSKTWRGLSSDATGTRLAAITGTNHIYISTNGGSTWSDDSVLTSTTTLNGGVAFSGDGLTAIVAGWGSAIWHTHVPPAVVITDNGGNTTVGSGTIGTGTIGTGTLTPDPWVAHCYLAPPVWQAVASSATGQKMAAIAWGDAVWLSTDYGATWTKNVSTASQDWYTIASSADGVHLAAATNDDIGHGLIYTSADSGATWNPHAAPGDRLWWSISSSTTGANLVAVSGGDRGSGTIWTSSDYGSTWTQRTIAGVPQNWSATAISAGGTKMAVADSGGSIWVSINSGTTWNEQIGAGHQNWTSLAASNDFSTIFGVGDPVAQWVGVNTGAGSSWTWTAQSGTTHSWSGTAASAAGVKTLSSVYGGTLYIGTLSGSTWTYSAQPDSGSWRGVAMSQDGSRMVAVSKDGCIFTLYTPNSVVVSTGATGTTSVSGDATAVSSSNASGLALTKTLSIGSSGSSVSALQQYLINSNYLAISAPTGYYGQATAQAVSAWQTANGLDPVGVVGPQSRALLNGGTVASAGSSATITGLTDAQKQAALQGGSASTPFTGPTPVNPANGTGVDGGGTIGSTSNTTIGVGTLSGPEPLTGTIWVSENAPAYPDQSIPANTTHAKIASYIIHNGTSESVMLNSLWVTVPIGDPTNLANLAVMVDSASTGTRLATVAGSNTLAVSANVAARASSVLDLYADTGAATSGSLRTNLLVRSATGATTHTVYNSSTGIEGQTITLVPGWVQSTASGAHTWESVATSSDGQKLIAADYNGYVYTSTDRGAHWTHQTILGMHYWTGVASSSDGTRLEAVIGNFAAGGGWIWQSTNGGATWNPLTAAGINIWSSVSSSADGMKLVATAGNHGPVFVSTDGGATWTSHALSTYYSLGSSSVSADGSMFVVAMVGGSIYTSIDHGVTWVERTSAGAHMWTSVSASYDGTKIVAANNAGYIYTSNDSGATWAAQSSSGTHNWLGVASPDGFTIAAADGAGYMYVSTDGGATWSQQTSAGSHGWYAVAASTASWTSGTRATNVQFVAVDNTPGSVWTYN